MTNTAIEYEPAPVDFRIYVACLASYNNGVLHGAWIDCDGKDADEIQTEVDAMLRASKFPNVSVECPDCEGFRPEDCDTCNGKGTVPSAEEYAIHDHEGFGSLIGESTPISEVAEIVDCLESAYNPEALKLYAENLGKSVTSAADSFDDAFCGEWDSELAYAENLMDDCYTIPPELANYIDYEAFRRDLFCGDCWSEPADGGNVYIFRSV